MPQLQHAASAGRNCETRGTSLFCSGVGGYCGGIFTCKYEANMTVFQAAEVIMKCLPTKRIDVLQATGMNEDLASALAVAV